MGNFGFDLDGFIEEHGAAALVEPPGPPTTALVRIDPDGSAHVAADDLDFPNGTVITPDGKTMIVAETLAGRLTAFDIEADGELSGSTRVGLAPWCAPDGICLDAEGRVWVANAITSECMLVAEGGAVVDRVSTSQNSFACMLGRRRPAHPLHHDRADQHRVGGQRGRGPPASNRPGCDVGRRRAALTPGPGDRSGGQRSRVSARRRLRTPWPMRCSFSMRANRTWPSPPGPKPTPGEVATSASCTRNLENSSDPISR